MLEAVRWEDPVAVIRHGCSPPRPLHVLLLLLCLLLPAAGRADASALASQGCRADQLKQATVTALAEFKHRGNAYSMLMSTMDIGVPATWAHASDLLLDEHSPLYREALRCLVGKPALERDAFLDYEWRFKPVAVKADGQWVRVRYVASTWVQSSSSAVGPWELTVENEDWHIELTPAIALKAADWERVEVNLSGPGALTATPPPAFGEGGSKLSWRHVRPGRYPAVTFRPPAVQRWNYITTSVEPRWVAWETWGTWSASAAFWYVASGALLLVAARRLRRSLAGKTLPDESRALRLLRWWSVLLIFLGLLVNLGDNLYRLVAKHTTWDYSPTLSVFSLAFLGLALCFLGSRSTRLRVSVSAIVLAILVWYVVAEVYEVALLPSADLALSTPGLTVAALVCTLLMSVCWLGVFAATQRILLIRETRIPTRVMVPAAVVAAMGTVLWSYLAFQRSWDRVSWLGDPDWPEFQGQWDGALDGWWWRFPGLVVEPLLAIVSILAPLAVLGVLRVCRVEQYDKTAFTPAPAEKFLLLVLFAITLAPPTYYYGLSAYAFSLLLSLGTAWGVLALGSSVSVLERPFADNAPLGMTISRTERADILRLARRFRELQARLSHLGTADADRVERESLEAQIDRLDQSLPAGVRPVDLPFACGPMATWWGNARRGAVVASLFGLPATGLLYWTNVVKGNSWAVYAEESAGFPGIMVTLLFWQIAWLVAGFFLGALWRDLPGRHGPTKALFVTLAFAVPAAADFLVAQLVGDALPEVIGAIAAFGSVMTCTGLVMDLQTFQNERRYWATNAGMVAYIYQMRFASVAFFVAQLLALATLWKTLSEVTPSSPTR
ncbi:DUF6185 family protein [Streptomyces sp. NPDC059071]|uniref:DUF6185 family protein n=1 Tax=unclassified Streptomyces TaxID=2593676 RepID=UPI0036508856